jgi:hypothetical protein
MSSPTLPAKVFQGAWRASVVSGVDPVPPQSIPANVAHMQAGGIPDGKPPIQGAAMDLPIVVEDPDPFNWGDADVPGWDRYGNTDMTDHDAYDTTGGENETTALAEGNAWRSVDLGMPQGRTQGMPGWTERNSNVTINTPFFKDGGSLVSLERASKVADVNNPDGIPGHSTPKVTVRNFRKFPTPYRNMDEYSASKIKAYTATPTVPPGRGDRYSSPFISSANAVAYPAGPRQPAMYTQPTLWDQQLATANTAVIDNSSPTTAIIEPGIGTGWSNGF